MYWGETGIDPQEHCMWEARCKDLAVSASTDTRNDAAIYADLK